MGKHKGSMGVSMSAFRITPKNEISMAQKTIILLAAELEQFFLSQYATF